MPQAIHIDGGAKLIGGKYDGAKVATLPVVERHPSGRLLRIVEMAPPEPLAFGREPRITGSLRRHLYEKNADGNFEFRAPS